MTVTTGLGAEVDNFLSAISPTEDIANGKLGSSAKSYKPGLDWFQKFLSEQALEKDSEFKRVKNIPAFFVAVRLDNKIDIAIKKRFPDEKLLKGYSSYLEKKLYAPKTVRAYVGSVQALFKKYKIGITTSYSDLPPATTENPKYTWKLQEVGEFLKDFDPLYRCLGIWFLESGLSNIDLLKLTYDKVKQQYENDVSPFCINMVRWKTRKFQIKFRTFIGDQGIEAFREYYESLPNALKDDDKIFPISSVAIQTYFARRSQEFLEKVQPKNDSAKKEVPEKKHRNLCVPSSLRTAFRTFLADGKVPNSEIEYYMGHNLTSDLEKSYTNRSDDSWREVWHKTVEPLVTFKET